MLLQRGWGSAHIAPESTGSPTQSKVALSTADTAKFIQTTTAYTSNGNYAQSTTDARGKTASAVTDSNKGMVTSATDPKGQTVNYTYDVLRWTTKSATMLNGSEVRTQYTYLNCSKRSIRE